METAVASKSLQTISSIFFFFFVILQSDATVARQRGYLRSLLLCITPTHRHTHTLSHSPIHVHSKLTTLAYISAACMHACMFVCVCVCVRVHVAAAAAHAALPPSSLLLLQSLHFAMMTA